MQQYVEVKRHHEDAIVLFRLGDFYEIFFDDAPIAAKLLDLTLTARSGGGQKVPMCGMPHHASKTYIERLLKAGRKVALCEQVEDPKEAKGLVKRQVTRVITPSTYVENESNASNPTLVGLFRKEDSWSMALLEPATGVFEFWKTSTKNIASELSSLAPDEVVTTAELAETTFLRGLQARHSAPALSVLPDWQCEQIESEDTIRKFFGLDTLRVLDLDPDTTIVLGLVLQFLRNNLKDVLPHVALPKKRELNQTMVLGPIVERSLEIFRSVNPDSDSLTLFDTVNKSKTPMGRRLLRAWLQKPLLSKEAISRRHAAVTELVETEGLLPRLRKALSSVKDMERLVARFSCGVANPKDASALRDSLLQVPSVRGCMERANSDLCIDMVQRLRADISDLTQVLERSIVGSPPMHLRDGGIFADGYDAALDRLRSLAADGKNLLAEIQAREIENTGIPSLKIGYNRVFGYYLEVSKVHADKVPNYFIRKQTLSNGERYVTEALKNLEQQIISAEEQAVSREKEMFAVLCEKVLCAVSGVQTLARACAVLDVLSSFATVAIERRYVCPRMTDTQEFVIKGGRHPVVETLVGQAFVDNDVTIDREERQLLLVTAPNMSGKSVYLRQCAHIAILAQAGSYVPAQEAHIGIVDRIFTRIGASDNLALGESTFAVEMIETAQILHGATERSLLLLDEIGRGTSSADGLSIARAIIEFLISQEGPRPRTLFATHFHELTELELFFFGVRNLTFAVREWKGEVVFLYKVVDGASDQSYGIHVARLAGLPRTVTARAEMILKDLDKSADQIRHAKEGRKSGSARLDETDSPQLGLFGRRAKP